VTDGDGVQRSLMSPTMMSSAQHERHSAPSRIGRPQLAPPPPPPDVVQSVPPSPPSRRTTTNDDEVPSVAPPVAGRRIAESSPKAAPRTDLGFVRRTYKTRPVVEGPAVRCQQDSSPVLHARYADIVDDLPQNGFTMLDFRGQMTDDRRR